MVANRHRTCSSVVLFYPYRIPSFALAGSLFSAQDSPSCSPLPPAGSGKSLNFGKPSVIGRMLS